jgi:hypothetical protein
MEIQALKLLVTEHDLNEVALRQLALGQEVRKVRVRLAPEGAYVTGVYHMLINVSFETFWELTVADGKLQARLSSFKALGIPVSLLKSMIMTAIRDAVGEEDAVEVNEEVVRLDVERLLAREGIPVRTNLKAVRCQAGQLVIEAAAGKGA